MFIARVSADKTVLYKIIHRQRWFHIVMASENTDLSCFKNSQVCLHAHTHGAACPEHQGFHTPMKKVDTECAVRMMT